MMNRGNAIQRFAAIKPNRPATMMNAQQIFDTVATHLITQRVPSRDPIDCGCMYRSGELKCAAGVLISDENYFHNLEGQNADATPVMEALEYSGVPKYLNFMVMELQYLHDDRLPAEWREQLAALAARNGLSSAVLATI